MKSVIKSLFLTVSAISLFFTSCEKHGDRVRIEETRRKTVKDNSVKLFANSSERFLDTKPSPVQGTHPDTWLVRPARQFRLLNYSFGETGLGEVYVSISSGRVLENVNRWLNQFGKEDLNQEAFESTQKIPIAGVEGIWIEADGEYGAGMGAESKPGYGLAGVVAEIDGKILTVKMVGPKHEVAAEKEHLRAFVGSLRFTGSSTEH